MSRHRFAPSLLAIVILISGCAGSGNEDRVTYTDPGNQSLFSMPANWNLYELDELSALAEVPFINAVDSIQLPAISTVVFDGAPVKDVGQLTDDLATATFPVGAVTIRSIGSDERDFVSRNLLTQAVLPYRSLGSSQEITKEDFSFGNGYDGVRLLVAYQEQGSDDVGVAYLISVTDADDRQMYSIVAGCSQECFIANQATIEELVDSWLVNTRG